MGTAGSLVKVDSNYIFGSVQKVDLASTRPDNQAVLANNFAVAPAVDARVVPAGGAASRRITHVFFILHENKTFDSMLGNMPQFGPFASLSYTDSSGATFTDAQYTAVSKNVQALAARFAVGVNYYSDAEESDAGHQFAGIKGFGQVIVSSDLQANYAIHLIATSRQHQNGYMRYGANPS